MIMVPSAGDQVQYFVQMCHYNTLAVIITVVTGLPLYPVTKLRSYAPKDKGKL